MQPPMTDDRPEPPPPAAADDGRARFTLDATGATASAAMAKLKDNVEYWVARGRYNKVRVKRGGKAVLPDIPVGALFAVEAATFFWTGLLRAALVNVVGRALEVDSRFVRAHLQMGVLRKMQGRSADALGHFEKVVALDPRSEAGREAAVHLKKLKGG